MAHGAVEIGLVAFTPREHKIHPVQFPSDSSRALFLSPKNSCDKIEFDPTITRRMILVPEKLLVS